MSNSTRNIKIYNENKYNPSRGDLIICGNSSNYIGAWCNINNNFFHLILQEGIIFF